MIAELRVFGPFLFVTRKFKPFLLYYFQFSLETVCRFSSMFFLVLFLASIFPILCVLSRIVISRSMAFFVELRLHTSVKVHYKTRYRLFMSIT